MHSPNPRPIVSTLILFTKLFSCFLCVLVIFSLLGRGWPCFGLFFSLRSPSGIWLPCFISSDGHVCYWRLFVTPHSIIKGTPVLVTTSTLLRPLLLLRRDWLNRYAYQQFLSRPELSHSLLSISQTSQTPFMCLAGPSVVHDIPCHFFSNVDVLVVYTALRLIMTPRRSYIPYIFLLDMVIVFICGSPLVCIALVQCFERRQGEIRILRVAVTIVDYTCIAIFA
jgi:hypothetical protein